MWHFIFAVALSLLSYFVALVTIRRSLRETSLRAMFGDDNTIGGIVSKQDVLEMMRRAEKKQPWHVLGLPSLAIAGFVFFLSLVSSYF